MSAVKPVHWEWDDSDRGGWTQFDGATSAQVEKKLAEAINSKTTGVIEIELSAGPWFGQSKNKGIYRCILRVDCSGDTPIIHSAQQSNANTGYKRPIRRRPALDPPLEPRLQKIVDRLEGRWEWKDDYGWKEYDLETIDQIEQGYQQKQVKCDLSAGGFFSKAPGVYYIEYNYLSVPASAQQNNRKSRYGRWVRRVPVQKNSKRNAALQKQHKFLLEQDKHFLYRKFYAPLSSQDFALAKGANEGLTCSICLSDLEKEDLLETQVVSTKLGNLKHKTEEKDAACEYDLSRARGFVVDKTIVGLNKCSRGHYFHADCICQHFKSKQQCPNCKAFYGEISGHQPEGRLYITAGKQNCLGFEAKDSVKMLFEFPGGKQNEHHPNPGKMYLGDLREAFVPNNKEGREAAMLTRLAFKRKLIFQIGRSLTLQQDNRIVFGSIHLKTSVNAGPDKHGFPDAEYFTRFKEELKAKGITPDMLNDEDRKFIDAGFSKR